MDVVVNFLLRLSVKRIFVCKLVCKTWHDLISKPEFAKLHFDQAQACPLVHISGDTAWSRTLYLLQPEEKDFELKLELRDHCKHKSNCDCHVEFELDSRFKLPWGNPQMMFDGEDFHLCGVESNNSIKLSTEDLKYEVVNSCNGLLCLSSPYKEPRVVCNPVTGEFVNLPKTKKDSSSGVTVLCGFGFNPDTNQYKVVRIFQCRNRDRGIGAQVHTLGTKTWKDIEFSGKAEDVLRPAYCNGFLYWVYAPSSELRFSLITFDVTNECFGSILAPPFKESGLLSEPSLGVLGGELSISCLFISFVIEVWVMKNDGATNVWSKVFSIGSDNSSKHEIWHIGPCQPIIYLNDGGLLLFGLFTNSLIYKHPRKHRFRCLKFCGMKAESVVAHIPSFISLKDALSGHNVNVHHVKSR